MVLPAKLDHLRGRRLEHQDAEGAETALAKASTVPGPLYPRSTLWLRAQEGGSATSVWARANHPPTVANTIPPAKNVTPVMTAASSNHTQLLRMVRPNRWTDSELAWPRTVSGLLIGDVELVWQKRPRRVLG